MLTLSTLLKYYKRPEIQKAIVEAGEHKEVAVKYGDRGFGRRPDILKYPKDVLELAKKGATSFHCSEELWHNPLQVTTGMRPSELDELRIGWDLILDIDCKELEYSKIAADLVVQALKHHGIKSISVKFSGNHGFHIGVPFEALPEIVNSIPVKNLFPEGPRRIAAYLKEMIREWLSKKLLSFAPIAEIAEHVAKQPSELIANKAFDPFTAVSIDTILIAPRHLYRMPYCFNEKSGLISVVIPPERILYFSREEAKPEKAVPKLKFMPREGIEPGEAKRLVVQAFDFKLPEEKIQLEAQKQEFEPLAAAVPEQYFPPCIQRITQGLEDGRKRALFILVNFLTSIGWDYDKIENWLNEWNKRNKEPLRDVLVLGHLRYHKAQKKAVLPPNCANKGYMVDMGVCKPDCLCPKIKNPVNYAILKQKLAGQSGRGKKCKE